MLHDVLCPRLEVFDDGWRVLSTFGDVLERMGRFPPSRNNAIALAAFCTLPEAGGFVDRPPVQQCLRTPDDRWRERSGTAGPERQVASRFPRPGCRRFGREWTGGRRTRAKAHAARQTR